MWIEILITDWLMHGALAFVLSFTLALLIGIISGSGYWTRFRQWSYTQRDVPFILLVFFCCTLWLFLLGLQHLLLDGVRW